VSQKKTVPVLFFNNSMKHWPTLIIFGMQHHEETRQKCLYARLTLILLVRYPVKCRSRSLAVYNNEFILGSTCWLRKSSWDHKICYLFNTNREWVYRTKILDVDELK